MAILKLPTEIIQEIGSYLDWPKGDLYPSKPSIVNLSLTCSQLREALLPIAFRDVVLRLKWQGGSLVEPCLYKLRLNCPRLAEHIRSVTIITDFDDDDLAPRGGHGLNMFVPPKGRPNWLDLESNVRPNSKSTGDEYRERADRAAWKLASLDLTAQQETPAEDAIRLALAEKPRNRAALDALTICMLCIPLQTNRLQFSCLRRRAWPNARNSFAARVMAAALDLLRHGVEDLTFVSNVPLRDQRFSSSQGDPVESADDRIVGSELISILTPRRLVLATGDDTASSLSGVSALSTLRLDIWHSVSHTVRLLELKYMQLDTVELLQLIQGFESLEGVLLHRISLRFPGGHQINADLEAMIWLSFCLDLRKTMRHVKIELGDLRGFKFHPGKLPGCATSWISEMAVPCGAVIDFEREERLREDFHSFLPLWAAEEEDERGRKALKEWNGVLGRELCDAAMSGRWR